MGEVYDRQLLGYLVSKRTFGSHVIPQDYVLSIYTIHMYSGITSGRVLNGELLYTKILEVNLQMQTN